MDPLWGTGIVVTGSEAGSSLNDGGAHFWTSNSFGPDQYSQIRITGTMADWVGVAVRGQALPGHGYWLAIKADGAYLYAFVNGAFHLLAHDASDWTSGDTLKLEVRTVAANTARLVVHRNGSPILTHDDAEHFIATGQPGIGLYASTSGSLDDWEGGTLTAQ
jgi:hypothetical protein